LAALAAALVLGAPAPARAQSTQAPAKPSTSDSQKKGTSKPPAGSTPETAPRKPAGAAKPAEKTAPRGPRAFRLTGFFGAGYQGFAATDTFNATLDSSGGGIVGGGAAVTHCSGLFFQVDVTRFSADGERAFVFNHEVFKLGIPLSVTITPVEFTGGYKFFTRPPRPKKPAPPKTPPAKAPATPGKPRQEFALSQASPVDASKPARPAAASAAKPAWGGLRPYVGAGISVLGYQETSDFATSGDDTDESYTGYHLLGGIERPLWKWLGAAAEVNYRWVKDGFGKAGLSKHFEEDDLGGPSFRAKLTASW
jgi:hypothetical protein